MQKGSIWQIMSPGGISLGRVAVPTTSRTDETAQKILNVCTKHISVDMTKLHLEWVCSSIVSEDRVTLLMPSNEGPNIVGFLNNLMEE